MGEVIRFPDEADHPRRGRYIDVTTEPATVSTLPVRRVEREKPDAGLVDDVLPAQREEEVARNTASKLPAVELKFDEPNPSHRTRPWSA